MYFGSNNCQLLLKFPENDFKRIIPDDYYITGSRGLEIIAMAADDALT